VVAVPNARIGDSTMGATSSDAVHLGRQPIFDRTSTVIAYELLFRDAQVSAARFTDHDAATADVIVRTFGDFGLTSVVGEKLAFVNLPRSFLVGRHPLPFSPKQVVLEVLEDVAGDEHVIAGMTRLSKAGFRFALDDFTWTGATEPLLELCQFVKLDVLAHTSDELDDAVQRLRPHPVRLIAEKVETREQLEHCRRLGFDYFQGYFLSRPAVLSRRSMTTTRLACLSLLAALAEADWDLDRVEQPIRSDPGLSLRVLKMVNSAGIGLRRRVNSIREAVLLLGPKALLGWALLLSLSSATGTSVREHVVTALVRARMCELVAERTGGKADEAFIVGMLSSLELLLGVPLPEILRELPIETAVSGALLERSGHLGAVLADVLNYEARQPTHLLGIDQLRSFYVASLGWAGAALAGAD
jgi:EAL and modified HD-GYP domain-containing signal transduction protein